MKYLALFLLSVCFAGGPVFADDQVRRVQEALRKRNLYFGEIDGRKNDEVTGAIKRYQQRQGFPPTGEVNPPTLHSLGIAAPTRPGAEWPEGPVLRSDVAREITAEDRRFLEEHPSRPDPIAEADPLESPAAPPVVISPEASPPARTTPAPPPAPPAESAPAQLVRKYLAACETNRLAEEMGFYAPSLNYFDHGQVDAAFVARDVQRFYKRWPHRHYELLDCRITPLKEGEWEAKFRIGFRYHNDKAVSASGKSVNFFKIRQFPEGLYFVSMKEQVVRE